MIYIGNDDNITLKVGTETVTAAYMGTEQVYPNVVPPIDYSMMYFTTEAIDDTLIHLSENMSSFEVSKDNGQTWTTTGSYPGIFNLGLLAGEKAYWRCSLPYNNGGTGSSPGEYGIAHMDGTYRFKVYGNIMSLFWEDRFEDKTVFPGSSGDYVYGLRHFFKNATTLVDVQNLVIPVTEQYLCSRMFEGCSNLVNSPQLPSMNLVQNCYGGMFNTCTSLVTPPVLPATTLASNCYNAMFYGCTSLTTAPELPARTLANNCYYYMFYGCTNLTTAPELPARTLAQYCYSSMFYNCSSLQNITCYATDISASYCTSNWVSGVAATGTFRKAKIMQSWDTGTSGIPNGWTSENYVPEKPFVPTTTFTPQGYVSFTANQDDSVIELLKKSTNQTLYFSKNGTDWMELDENEKMTMNNGDIYYCCGMLSADNTASNYTRIILSGSIAASGNCNAIWNYSDLSAALKSYCGYQMFSQSTALTTAPNLPATTLASNCYNAMFRQCTSLTTAPELPATTLVQSCYNGMFSGCTSLTTAPELPATTLVTSCYREMFYGCSSLNYIKAMSTTAPGTSYTRNWVSGVSATGTFVKNSAATWTTTGVNGIPTGWDVQTASE